MELVVSQRFSICGGTYELQRERLIKCARLRAQIGAKRRKNHAGKLSVPPAVGLRWSSIWKIWISFVISIWDTGHGYYIGVSRRSAQATAGKGLTQGPYVAARAGVEPTTLRLKVIVSTKAPPRPTNALINLTLSLALHHKDSVYCL